MDVALTVVATILIILASTAFFVCDARLRKAMVICRLRKVSGLKYKEDDDEGLAAVTKTVSTKIRDSLRHAVMIGRGVLSKSGSSRLILQSKFWPEAVDPKHRHGAYLHAYYDRWMSADTKQDFFSWLDFGGGRNLDLPECSRSVLNNSSVRYCDSDERKQFEVELETRLIDAVRCLALQFRETREPVRATDPDGKWIFVVSSDDRMYVHEKVRGEFHHSSFLGGGALKSAGQLRTDDDGVVSHVCPHSGHYHPGINEFHFLRGKLQDMGVDLTSIEWMKPQHWIDDWDLDTAESSLRASTQ